MKSREEILREAREKAANKSHESISAEKPKIKVPAEINSKQSLKDKQREITSASIEKISADNFQKIVNDYNLNKSMEDSIKILQIDEKIGYDESVLIVEEIRKTLDETSEESSDDRTLNFSENEEPEQNGIVENGCFSFNGTGGVINVQCNKCFTCYDKNKNKCPKCGSTEKKTKEQKNQDNKKLLGCLGCFLILFLPMFLAPLLPDKDYTKEEDTTHAWFAAISFIEDVLNDPSSAEFCHKNEASIQFLGDGEYKISGYVRANNVFGGKVRNSFVIYLRINKDGSATLGQIIM